MRRKEKIASKLHSGKKIFLFAGVMIVVLSGIILPGNILSLQEQKDYGQVNAVDRKYLASSSVMARNTSSSLTTYERLQLITGQWDSDIQKAKNYEMEQENYEAVVLARKKMKELYERKQYPADLSYQYANWYSWSAIPYKAVDTTFHTYTSYYWVIQFEKFDKSETHTIQMLEDGTVFLANASISGGIDARISEEPQTLPGTEGQTALAVNINTEPVEERIPYEIDISGLQCNAVTLITTEEAETYFLLFQLSGTNRYLYTLTPSIRNSK